MSGSARNFRSARDRTEERQPPTKIRKQNAYSGIERRSDSRVWSDFEENHSELPSREPLHGNRYMQKDDRRKLERERSPGFDRWGSENKSSSLSDGWDLPERGKAMSQGRSRSRDRRMSQSRSRSRSRGRARSRSRSRGRARDRSRSPFEVHRRVSYGMIDRSGTGTSSQPCKYFAAGMCRKGSQCNFFHPDNLGSRDGKYYENDPEPRRRGRLEYRDEVEFSDNYERGKRNVSADYDLKRQPIRSGKPFCKDFGMGKCHRDNCRFSHDDPAADDKWSNDRRGRNHDERTKTWNGPTWDDYNKTSDSAKSSGWGEKLHDPTVGEKRGDDRRGRNLDEKMKSWNDTKDTLDAAKSTGWGEGSVVNPRFHDHDHDPKAVENRSDDRRRWNSNEKSKVWNGPTWDDAKDTSDAAKSTGWGDNSVGKIKLQDPTAAEHRGDDRQDRNLDEKTKLWYEVKDISDAANSTGWGEGSVMNRKLHDPIEKQTGDRRGPDFDEKTKPANAPTFDDVKGISDTVKAGGWGDGIGEISTFHDPTAADERGLHIIHESSLSQSHEISTRIDEQNVTLEAGALQTSIRVSENSYNIAVTEDFNALNEVKVSDQNGGSMSSLPFPTSTVTDDSGARLISSNGHNIDLNVPFQTMNPETEAETLPKETGKPSSKILDTGAPREVSQNVVNPKAEEQENINGKVEESNNNVSKEEKAMRVFKIALVEFVKEILKPKWKEGQMSREVHKTIVKKTVDKVSSTIPGDQIPNTQEKISQYLSFSKGKISKLVHAYVERFLKT